MHLQNVYPNIQKIIQFLIVETIVLKGLWVNLFLDFLECHDMLQNIMHHEDI